MTLIVDNIGQTPFILTGNPVELSFRKVGINQLTGAYAYIIMSMDMSGSGPAPGQFLQFNLANGTSIKFEFLAVTGDDATLIMPYGGGDVIAYGKYLANEIYRHPLINADYYVNFLSFDTSSNALLVQIIARERGADYNIEIDTVISTVAFSTGYPSVTVTYADDDTPLSDYQVIARATYNLDPYNNPTLIDVNDLVASVKVNNDNNEGVAVFHDLPEIGDNLLGVDIPYSAFQILPCRKSYALLVIEVKEQYDTGFQLAENVLQNTTVYKKTALMKANDWQFGGGGGQVQLVVLGKAGSQLGLFPYDLNFANWLTPDGVNYNFLSLQPDHKKLIDINSPEWLTFCNPAQGSYTVRFIVYCSDGTSHTFNVKSPLWGTGLNEPPISAIPTGFVQNSLSTGLPSSPLYYTVQCYPAGGVNPISDLYTYTIDTRYFRDTRYFIYQNSLGQIDTLRCVGVQKFSIDRKSTTTERALISSDRAGRGSIEMIYNELTFTWTMRTGFLLSRSEKDFLLDFLRSNYVAEVIGYTGSDGTQYALIPIDLGVTIVSYVHTIYRQPYRSCVVDQTSIDMYQWDDGTWALEWKMYYANKEINYSTIPAIPEVYYDTFFDFTINITELGPNPLVNISVDNQCAVYLNGVLQTVEEYITTPGIYHYKVKGANITLLSISPTDLLGVLTVTYFESPSLQNLEIIGFDLSDDYLCNRLTQFSTLVSLDIEPFSDPGFSIDKMLAAYCTLMQSGTKYNIEALNFPNSTPSATGNLLANYLMDEFGITVNTL